VVTVASNADVGIPGGVDFTVLKDGPIRRKKMTPWTCYFQSKWGDNCYAKELARRYGDQGIVSTSLNPGIIDTDLARNLTFMVLVAKILSFRPDPFGAITSLYAATAPEAASMNGEVRYLVSVFLNRALILESD
jgi:NAD(P)-dependent dehydrogenase (short-subunit alcohol dehydrogenase family)